LIDQMNEPDDYGVHGGMQTAVSEGPVTPTPAFEEFFEIEQKRLLRAMYVLTGNTEEAEEIAQDSFLALWERWGRVRAMEDPVGYLYRTAMNRHRSRRRRAIRATRRAVGAAEGGNEFAAIDERDALARVLASLSLRRRQALVLTEMLGYGSPEAGRILGVSDVTVRRLASDARAQLRHELEVESDG
jgi:RNA polymerase sigma factor (sigma-70 family)